MKVRGKNKKNSQECKVFQEIIVDEEKENSAANFYSNCEETSESLLDKNLSAVRTTSTKLEKINDELTYLQDTIVHLGESADYAKKNIEVRNQNVSDIHGAMLESNNSKSKCMGAGGVLGSTGGAIVIIAGASASSPIVAGAAVFIGAIIAFCCAGVAVNGFYNLYKKPNSTVENIDIEKGMDKSLHGIVN